MAPHRMVRRRCVDQAGFTLIEAIVAMMIVAMVVIEYIGIRTSALIDATEARNWRLAREIAEEKMSELQAGARETPPESGELVRIEKYEGFAYKIVIGESAVADVEAEAAQSGADSGSPAGERLDWQREREDYRRAREQAFVPAHSPAASGRFCPMPAPPISGLDRPRGGVARFAPHCCTCLSRSTCRS